MNKAAIKNFAIWARNKLIADITYKAGLLGISAKEIKSPLLQSTKDVQFFDIGTKEPYAISGIEIKQREKLKETINNKAQQSDYATAYKAVVEEVAYTWFNRLIAVRFMEVNDYLPSRIRVLSSESATKTEPDLVTTPFDSDLEFTPYEKDRVVQLTHDNQLDELFRMLFIKQCNALNAILPNLFEKTSDYTELLLNVSFTDTDGVVYHLVHDIKENDFRIRTGSDEEAIKQGDLSEEDAPCGQVEIIGWLYQYYNTEPKDEAFALLKKNIKITKERIPAATQLFTPDWIVRYMVENSLGRIFIEWSLKSGEWSEQERIEKEKALAEKMGWKYYLPEAEQEPEVRKQIESQLLTLYTDFHIEDVKVIDPCMGSGHILVYAFDVLMQIYESAGYSQRDAAKSIVAHNIYGLDIDNRAYQIAYFAVMMKARQYNRRILNGETDCHVYSIQESNGINRSQLKYFGAGMDEMERNTAVLQMQGLLDTFTDAKEYGSIINVENYNWELLYRFVGNVDMSGQMTLDAIGIEDTKEQLSTLVGIGAAMAQKYDVVVTNPPYMGLSNGNGKLNDYVKKNYHDSKADLFAVFIEKCWQMAKQNRYQAMITQHTWMFQSSFEKLREKLQVVDTVNMVHLGARAFEDIGGEVVQTTSFVIRKSNIHNYKAVYARLVNYNSQKAKEGAFLSKTDLHTAIRENFSKIPGMPVAYWASDSFCRSFENSNSLSNIVDLKVGISTADNSRFVRQWQEIDASKMAMPKQCSKGNSSLLQKKWFPFNNGGQTRKWYGNNYEVINWENDGFDIVQTGRASIRNKSYYFREGVTWTDISTGKIGVRYFPYPYIFSTVGLCAFGEKYLTYVMALLNSTVCQAYLGVLCPTLHFNIGDIAKIPAIIKNWEEINLLSKKNVKIAETDWNAFEISWDFIKHPLLKFMISMPVLYDTGNTPEPIPHIQFISTSSSDITRMTNVPNNYRLEATFNMWQEFTQKQFAQLKANEEELNRIFIDIYGLQDEVTPEVEDKDITIRKADLGRDIRSFVSYAVGCMFGRYSLDVEGLLFAGGEYSVESGVMRVKCPDGTTKLSTLNSENYFPVDKDNIIPITDEEYFEDDIVGLFVAFVKKTFGAETLEQNLDFIAKALGNKGNTSREVIRNYFMKDFFKDHCKVYQKRPIYWLFDSGKADGFKALIYMHRYDENTIGNLRIDYLHRMQRVYDSEIARMKETIENSTNAREVTAAEKRKEKLTKQLKETKGYDEKIANLALARIAIDLDDGVKVNYEKVQTGTDGKKLEVLAKI